MLITKVMSCWGVGTVYELSNLSGVSVENLLKYRFKCYQNRLNRVLVELEDDNVV